jgi:hypothetical protein
MYTMLIESELTRDEVETYLQQYSNDVRFLKIKEKLSKNDKGNRKIEVGIIRNYIYNQDKINTFSRMRLRGEFDRRHTY